MEKKEESKKEALDLGIDRFDLDCDYMEPAFGGEWVGYDDHMSIVGPLVMENLTLKLENEAYQKHIKELEDGKVS